jgi:hypothetical protein
MENLKTLALRLFLSYTLRMQAVAVNQPSKNKNRMSLKLFNEFAATLCNRIGSSSRGSPVAADLEIVPFGTWALELFRLQYAHNEPYRRFCQVRGISPDQVCQWDKIPAMPTAGFKELELSVIPPDQRAGVFHSSGTTEHRPSRHFHNAESLSTYEASLWPWFARHLVSEPNNLPRALGVLAPRRFAAPHSSLAYMFEVIAQRLPCQRPEFFGEVNESAGWTLDLPRAVGFLRQSTDAHHSVLLVGTAFSMVHLLDELVSRGERIQLPAGSRVMETGGYKGRSRALSKAELHVLIEDRLGVPRPSIVSEYGMSELSSQAYDRAYAPVTATAADPATWSRPDASRSFRFPSWARAQVISPETGREVGEGETGLIRVFDLANVYSVMAIQTEDLGLKRGGGFELVGRSRIAEPRGCSLMAA